ncbi:alkaline phosphatase family protein [Carboxylicivirga sediminis]|uniref:Alkaline phosphatase family protein n=1 Tax=Carboxylicivirga sediminis TaxID=2006564 RepID=A0A941IVZ2_9BACT|nr:alkaline phosphatase family protein [Carboxylicivirga sediminis]MBR8534825.1 alkaline phosphatase family protein [Carboxylicivirga sediminis]
MIKQGISLLLFIMAALTLSFGQRVPSQQPKLVVFILIDQLSTEQIVAFRDQFSDNGFNRLINGGAFFRNATYQSATNYYGAKLATLATGCNPSTHGIVSDWWYDYIRNKEVNALYGDITNANDQSISYPSTERLLTSTITDELKYINNGTSRVTAIGINPNYLVWNGGHTPDHIYQIDNKTGNFISITTADTTQAVPEWVTDFNNMKLLDTYSNREWGPLKNLNQYHQMKYFREEREHASSFLYSLTKQAGEGAYLPVIHSPFGNKLIRDFTVSQIINENYGKGSVTDVIVLQFTAKSVHGNPDGGFDAETQDMLLRLDLEIADILKTIDKEVGLEKALITLSSVSTPTRPAVENTKGDVPTGIFSGQKAASLANLFLMAKYGQGKWIMTYNDGQIFLNHALIAERKIDLNKVKEEAASFISDMEGVAYAIPISELRFSASDIASLRSLKLNYHPDRSGDIAIKINPGWFEELPNGQKIARNWNGSYHPLIMYGWKINPQNVYQTTPMTHFAPTICSFLQIPFPNGCEGEPLPGLIY